MSCDREEALCKAKCREKSKQCDVDASECKKNVNQPNSGMQAAEPSDALSDNAQNMNMNDNVFKSSLSYSYRKQYESFTPAQKMMAMKYAKENNTSPDAAVAKVAGMKPNPFEVVAKQLPRFPSF